MSPQNASRRLTPGMLVFIAIDVVLVVTLLIFFVLSQFKPVPTIGGIPSGATQDTTDSATAEQGSSGSTAPGGTTGASAQPTPSIIAVASATPAATDLLGQVGGDVFRLPSGNIACALGAGQVTCLVSSTSAATPTDPTCAGGVIGHAITMTAAGATSRPCTVANPTVGEVATLGYGESKTADGITCTASRSEGVKCVVDATGNGFSLARRGVTTF